MDPGRFCPIFEDIFHILYSQISTDSLKILKAMYSTAQPYCVSTESFFLRSFCLCNLHLDAVSAMYRNSFYLVGFQEFLRDVFHSCLFALPEDCCDERDLPLCKSKVHCDIYFLKTFYFVKDEIFNMSWDKEKL